MTISNKKGQSAYGNLSQLGFLSQEFIPFSLFILKIRQKDTFYKGEIGTPLLRLKKRFIC